jgi:hypothetical protein
MRLFLVYSSHRAIATTHTYIVVAIVARQCVLYTLLDNDIIVYGCTSRYADMDMHSSYNTSIFALLLYILLIVELAN